MQTKVRPEPTIPDHEVLRKIGGGAYGEVWLAQGVTGAMRAVKTVWHNDFEDERGFEREFEGILRYEPISRDHPGLVHILHVGRSEVDEEPFYYYVMELGDDVAMGREMNAVEYEPRTLRSDMKLADGEPLDIEECISVGRALADGLEHLHMHGLAHRDVKPSNVIFVDGVAKLADIGLVAQRGQQTFVGTEGFVPPEGPGSAQADVYSLGKVLYEMATGKDRLDFPELPDELPEGPALKRWRAMNSVICDICEPKISRRKLKTAGELAEELARLEAGRPRPFRMKPGMAAALFVGAVGAVGATQALHWEPWEVYSSPFVPAAGPPPPAEIVPVTIQSYPEFATILDEEGEPVGTAPHTVHLAVGTEVRYTLMLPNYKPAHVHEVVESPGIVIDPELEYFRPPEPGEPWEDVLGNRYGPRHDFHISSRLVDAASWVQFQEENKVGLGKIAQIMENGETREVVLASVNDAGKYTKWLEKKCRANFLKDENTIVPEMDHFTDLSGVNEDWLKKGLRPFRCEVRRQPRFKFAFSSNPAGATVYINGESVGLAPGARKEGDTTWEPLIEEVRAGKFVIIAELEGYKSYEVELGFKNSDDQSKPRLLHIDLEPEDIFGLKEWQLDDPWINSLGMRFVSAGDILMPSIWETRWKDYQAYVKAMKGKVKEPLKPAFADYGDDHPVVYVSREDAGKFCKWLTERERKQKLIAANHIYRLPTDLEWSRLAGLRDEEGDWPQQRTGKSDDFQWGRGWQPPNLAGNFADDATVVAVDRKIQGYDDGFATTAPVGQFLPNIFSLYDMAGNVQEWVSDDYNADGKHYVARGGAWNSFEPSHLYTSARTPVGKGEFARGNIYGFRVVLAKVEMITEKEPAQATTTP